MKLVKFRAEHAELIELQPAQLFVQDKILSWEQAKAFEKTDAFTLLDDDINVLFIGGILPLWHGRGALWSLISHKAGPHFTYITRGVKRFIETRNEHRLECYVDPGFEQGKRWAELLGFTCEGLMQHFYEDKRDALLYARVV